MVTTPNKLAYIDKVSNEDGVIAALAFDQRGALKRMMDKFQATPATSSQMETLKSLVSEELTPYASSILLDPEYGLPASQVKDPAAGLLLAYEKTGYDASTKGRLPDCLDLWSVKRLKEAGADVIKFLLYYDVASDPEINAQKQAYIERIGAECVAEDLPFFLEILSYDEEIEDATSPEFARVKPDKVIGAMEEFSKARYHVDVLKVEVPINMNYVEGYATGPVVHTLEEAKAYFKAQEAATHLPYIYLSAGVSASLFQDTLRLAHEAGAKFNGVLCGRSTWAGSVQAFIEDGESAARAWLQTQGRDNITSLNAVLKETATPWRDKL